MHIYFLGICGTAMGNAALLLKEQGHRVSGCDTGIYPPMSDVLASARIDVLEGYDAERLQQLAPDLVVIGNANSRGNVEVEYLLNSQQIPYVSLPQLLGEQILSGRKPVVITGTHGKTTTTALTAFLMAQAGKDLGYLVGGAPRDLPSGAHLGTDAPFVIEGDEYDSAFFDKRSKFIHYKPEILVINNIEFDHADIFRDLPDVLRTFNHLLRIVPGKGFVLANGDDANVLSLLPVSWTKIIKVGTAETNDLRICDFAEDESGSSFTLKWHGQIWGKVEWGIYGLYNARNAAMAALAAGLAMDADAPTAAVDLQMLQHYQGVKRRQEILLESKELVLMEDFGHHPTAISQTLDSLRRRYPTYTLAACFEPRSNTARTDLFRKEFEDALSRADAALIAPVHNAQRLGEDALKTDAMAEKLSHRGLFSVAYLDNEALLSDLKQYIGNHQKPLLVCFFSNGAFGGITRSLIRDI
ncbi:MAG: Mur ligase [Opitutales bacterium]|nr:Mur ligase [Opitutales bacterium]